MLVFLRFLCNLLILFSGQEVTNSIAQNLSEENQEIDNEIPSEVDMGPDDESGPSVFKHNLLAGRVYTHANDSCLTVFVTRGLNQKA